MHVADGLYRITEPFALKPEDSGTVDAPITYQAAQGARPIFSGGKPFGSSRAGVYGEAGWIAKANEVEYPLLEEIPDPPRLSIRDDFEDSPVGQPPACGEELHCQTA